MENLTKSVSTKALMAQSGVKFGTSGVRGLVSSMSNELCFAYALAFIQVLGLSKGSKIAIAIDLRPSSPTIASACCAAAEYAGLEVDYCGAIPTPALAYYAQQSGCAGIMVTGSHIPFDRNGIKFYSADGEITKEHEALISDASLAVPTNNLTCELPVVNAQAKDAYIKRYTDYFKKGSFDNVTLAFYEHSSVARNLLQTLLEALGAKVISLGRTNEFVPIDTEAVSQIDVERGIEWGKSHQFDAILSTDGDADRPLIGDERGHWMRGDIVGLLTSQFLNADAVATPVSCNTAIEKSNLFSEVVRTRIGSPYVIEAMEHLALDDDKVTVGFEANGGFLLGSSVGNLAPLCTRDAILPMLAIIALAKAKKVKVSQLTNALPERFTASDRIQSFKTEKSKKILGRLSKANDEIEGLLGKLAGKLSGTDTTDGLRMTFDSGIIIHYRPSGNAPELRCYVETDNQAKSQAIVEQALNIIQQCDFA